MEKAVCCTCLKPKATLSCELCTASVCKYCAQFLEENSFAFLTEKSPDLEHSTFCGPCFDEKIAPSLYSYQETLERAKEVHVFMKVQHKETRFLSRKEERIRIADCPDREEVILRMAFQAVQKNYNGLIDVEIDSTKVRNGTYQTTTFSGTGTPSQISANKLMKDRSFTSQPN